MGMKSRYQREMEEFVADPRDDSEGFARDADVAEVFDAEQHRPGVAAGTRKQRREMEGGTGHDPSVRAGDVDLPLEYAESIGDETIGGGMPTPDQDVVDEIGVAAGLTYETDEPLYSFRKLEGRDRYRWELNPASSEDYQERARSERGP